jgi:hypothetical protein
MPEVVAELVAEFNQILENLQLPQDAVAARHRLEKLTQRGCDEKFVLRVSYLYAYTANAFKKNAKDEASTPSSSRLIALPGLGMSRRELANHVRDTRHVAREIQRFLAVIDGNGKELHVIKNTVCIECQPFANLSCGLTSTGNKHLVDDAAVMSDYVAALDQSHRALEMRRIRKQLETEALRDISCEIAHALI